MHRPATGSCRFETGMYRPPSEGGSFSLLLRVTRNCPWNQCAFCAMYKGEQFSKRSPTEVKGDIDAIARICNELATLSEESGHGGRISRGAVRILMERSPELGVSHGFGTVLGWIHSGMKTAFLQDANSLVLATEDLVEILCHLRNTFPSLERVTSYARAKTLARKPLEELRAIRSAGLDRLHVGLESGDAELLKAIKKGATPQDHVEGGRRAMEAGFQLSEYWMPGLGGRTHWEAHAVNTARVLNAIHPNYIRSRPFFPYPGTPLAERVGKGDWPLLSPREQLMELKVMVEALELGSRLCFDHAGNYWMGRHGRILFSQSYEGYSLPEEKPQVLQLIEEGIHVQERQPQGPPDWLIR